MSFHPTCGGGFVFTDEAAQAVFMCMERLGMGVALLIRAVTCISVWIELKVVQSFRCLHSSWLDLCFKDVCL